MTYKQFLAKLAKTPRKWNIDSSDRRIVCQNGRCPLGIFSHSKLPWPEEVFEKIGITLNIAARIADAADNIGCDKTRRDLLKACGLKEHKP